RCPVTSAAPRGSKGGCLEAARVHQSCAAPGRGGRTTRRLLGSATRSYTCSAVAWKSHTVRNFGHGKVSAGGCFPRERFGWCRSFSPWGVGRVACARRKLPGGCFRCARFAST